MNYYIDTEFHEYKKKPFIGKATDTIELISIGIVAEDGREYYNVCKEFDVRAAWNNEWLRENVLKDIWKELNSETTYHKEDFTYKGFKRLIDWKGKSKTQIANEIIEFTYGFAVTGYPKENTEKIIPKDINFYAYYADYDWVVFCWLFGRMIDLPKGFPMYCIDLKQELDSKVRNAGMCITQESFNKHLKYCKRLENYPKQSNEHNALDDAKWNLKLHEFIKSL